MLTLAPPAPADRLELADGTAIEGCFVRDEGTQILLWRSMEEVGGPPEAIPRSRIKGYEISRGEEWDAKPSLPDLSVTFLEIHPKLAGLHGRVDYDSWGRPTIRGASQPEPAVEGLKLRYRRGEEVTLTAHVKNVGFAPAGPFEWVWLVDGREIRRGRHAGTLDEMEEATFPVRWRWQEGLHEATFRVTPSGREIASTNDSATDPLWGFGFTFVVHPRRVEAWHRHRTAYGTFSFEDFYRWHVDIMNRLFEASVYPSSPAGIRARVRLDRIVYAQDVEAASKELTSPDGIRYDQGGWVWLDDDDRKGEWKPPTKEWRNQTEWSLPHELGHQLGLVDLYRLDEAGSPDHVWPDTGEPVAHFMTQPATMMHWHGSNLWSEACAGYLNATWDKPRGHYGDFLFAIPRECWLRVVDVNGRGVPGAEVSIFQRGVALDPGAKPETQEGVTWYPVVEDGNFDRPVSKEPVIVGATDAEGLLRLPNRPVKEVRTLNGFHRRPNPFGNINVVGQRGLLLVRVTKGERPSWFWLEIFDFNVAWFRGEKDRFTTALRTPYGSADSPLPPRDVKVERIDEDQARVAWSAPDVPRERHDLDRPIGFRVWRRKSSDGLNDRPWFPVATLGPAAREAFVDLREFPDDVYWFSKTDRFAVSSLGGRAVESELVECVLPKPK